MQSSIGFGDYIFGGFGDLWKKPTADPKPEYVAHYPVVDLAVVKDYGGWTAIQQKFFTDGGHVRSPA
jgi:ABC-type sulfate transport system substrate-binding protein